MIRSTFFGFGTALSALNSNQKALDVTGNNIANLNTPGYTRQRLDLYSIPSSNATDRYSNRSSYAVGQGVGMSGIEQVRDPFLDIRFRREVAEVGQVDSHLAALDDITGIFDEVQVEKLQQAFMDFRSQMQVYSGQVGQVEMDRIVRASAEQLTRLLNQYSRQLDTVREETEYNLNNVTVPKINDLLDRIGVLNQNIKECNLFGNNALELTDERNMLIDELATYIDIDVEYTPDPTVPSIDNLTIRFKADAAYSPVADRDQRVLVSNSDVSTLETAKDSDGNWQFYVKQKKSDDIQDLDPVHFASGALKGSQEMLNSSGDFDNPPNTMRGIGYFEKMLNTLAASFANAFNKANSTVDSDGNPVDLPLFESSDGSSAITAGNISISQGWLSGQYGMTTSKDSLPIPDGQDASGASNNLLHMIAMLDQKIIFNTNVLQGLTSDLVQLGTGGSSPSIGSFGTAVNGAFRGPSAERPYSASYYVSPLKNSDDKAHTINFTFNKLDGTQKTLKIEVEPGETANVDTIRNALLADEDFSAAYTVTKEDSILTIKGKATGGAVDGSLLGRTKLSISGFKDSDVAAAEAKLQEKYGGENASPIRYGSVSGQIQQHVPASENSYQVASVKLTLAGGASVLHNAAFKVGDTTYMIQREGQELTDHTTETIIQVGENDNAAEIAKKIAAQITADSAKENADGTANPNYNGGFVATASGGVLTISESVNRGNEIFGAGGPSTKAEDVASEVTVSYTGDPMTSGTITFHPAHLENNTGITVTDKDGNAKKFILTTDEGAVSEGDTIYVKLGENASADDIAKAMQEAMADAGIQNVTASGSTLAFDKTPGTITGINEGGRQLFTGTFEEFLTNIGNVAALEVSSKSSVLTSHVTVVTGIEDLRDGVSAVSLDEEGVNLLRFQKSYTAAARLMTTLDEALDVLINKMGIVGR